MRKADAKPPYTQAHCERGTPYFTCLCDRFRSRPLAEAIAFAVGKGGGRQSQDKVLTKS